MARVDLCGKGSGLLWAKKPSPRNEEGLVAEVSNTKPGITTLGNHVHFTKVAFGYHGNWFIGGDQHGNLYHIDIDTSRFRLVYKGSHCCTALTCCISRPNEVLVAVADYSVQCVDVGSCQLIATLRGHEASVKSLSLDSSGRFVLAVSSRDCVLWDLDSFTRVRSLNGGQEVGIQDVFFQPLSQIILTCFRDDSVHAWDSDSLSYKYQLPPPYGPAPHYRCFACHQDGQLLVGGGRSGFLHVWSLETRQLLKVVRLPSKIRVVHQLVFLPQSSNGGPVQNLGVLSQDSLMRVIDLDSCKLLYLVGSHDQMISSMQASPDGLYLVAVSDRGNLLIYSTAALAQSMTKTAPPVQIVTVEEAPQRSKVTGAETKPVKLVPQPAGGREVAGEKGVGERVSLDTEKLKDILKGFGEYPAKYRTFIWRYLLHLPGNCAAYTSLLDKGTHSAYVLLHKDYPIKSRKLLRVLQRTLSCLAHWAPIFGETPYLPGLVFPFVKLFQNNQLVGFEVVATLLLNCCSHWFEYFPNPPLNLLAVVENCLAHHDSHLLQHFITHKITSHHYAWPLLETMFSEVLCRDDWLRLWDNVFSNHPSFLLLLLVAYLTTARHTLLQCSSPQDFQYFFHHRSSLDFGLVIREAYRLQQTTPSDLHPQVMTDPFCPLSKGTYPVFNKYPKFIVDYQVRERERIRREETEYLRERQSTLELERVLERRRHEEEAWHRQQMLLVEAEEQRRKMVEVEEQRLSDQRARLQAMKRELKVKEVQVLDAARRRAMDHQTAVKEAEVRRLEGEVERQVLRREAETHTVLQDIEIRAMELEKQKGQLEHELMRCHEEAMCHARAEERVMQHQEHLEHATLVREVEEDGERERVREAQAKLGRVQADKRKQQLLREEGGRLALREEHGDAMLREVHDHAKLNTLREQQVAALTHELAVEEGSSEMHSSHSLASYPSPPGLCWSHRRDNLDKQESDLLSRVRNLRQKVVGHLNSTHSTATPQ